MSGRLVIPWRWSVACPSRRCVCELRVHVCGGRCTAISGTLALAGAAHRSYMCSSLLSVLMRVLCLQRCCSFLLLVLAMMAMVFVMWRVPKVGGGGALEAALPHAPASCLQLLRDLLAWNPLRRPSAKRALQYPFFLEVAAPAPPKVSILTLHPTHARPCSCHLTSGCLGA